MKDFSQKDIFWKGKLNHNDVNAPSLKSLKYSNNLI